MIIFNITKKQRIAVITIILSISIGLNIFSYVQNSNLSDKYTALLCMVGQFNQDNIITFVTSKDTAILDNKAVEIFDIKNGKIIKSVEADTLVQQIGVEYLNGITGPYESITGFPDEGYIVKIPFQEPLAVENKLLADFGIKTLEEVFVILPKQQKPYLLVLDERNRPVFYHFEGDTNKLLTALNFRVQ